MLRQDSFFKSGNDAARKRRHDGAENDVEEHFDIDFWLASQDASLRVGMIRDVLIPLMRGYRGDHAHKIYQLFAEEDSIDNYLQMMNVLKDLLQADERHSFIYDLLAIKQYFLQEDEFNKSLDALEEELQSYVARHTELNLPKNNNGKYYLPSEDKKCHKVLSGYMYEWAKQNGFAAKAKLFGYMSPATFLNLFKTKTIFKDSSPDVPSLHGMWSHSIQVWCANYRNKQIKFLQHTLIEVYETLGKLDEDIWNGIFDMGPRERSFSSPGAVTSSIRSDENRRPLLCGTIQRQYDKSYFPLHTVFGFFAPPPTAYKLHLIEKHGVDFNNGYIRLGL